MKELREILNECIGLIDDIYNVAMMEEIDNVRNKCSLLLNKLNDFFSILLQNGNSIDHMIIEKAEELVEALSIRDFILVMDITRFEMKPILEEYIESIGE